MRDMLCLSTYRDKTYIGIKVATAYWKARTCLDVVENMNDQNIGCQLIGLFVLDMLGVDSLRGGCYHNKHNKEFGLKRAVTNEVKYIVFGLLVCCYGFLISVILSYGANEGRNWHYAWLIITLLKCVFDLSVKQMMMSVVVNYGIPNLVKADVNIVRKILEECGLKLLRSKPAFHLNRFSPSDYLFASTYVAKVYPHLIESQLILIYRGVVPEPIQDKHKVANLENKLLPSQFRGNLKYRLETMFLSLMTVALWVGSLNPGIQKVILNIIPTMFFVSFSFVIMMISDNMLLVSIFTAVLLFVIGPLTIQIVYSRYENELLNNTNANDTNKISPGGSNGGKPLAGTPVVFDADGRKVTPTPGAAVDEEVGFGLQHKRSLALEADWMLTSSDSEVSDDDRHNKPNNNSYNIASDVSDDDSDDSTGIDLNKIHKTIQKSRSTLTGAAVEASLIRDKQVIAEQSAEEARKRQQERAQKKLARRLKARETAFGEPLVATTTTSSGSSSSLTKKNDDDMDKGKDNGNNSQLRDHNVNLTVFEEEDDDKDGSSDSDSNVAKFQSNPATQYQRRQSSSGSRRAPVRHSRSSVLKRRDSAVSIHEKLQQLPLLKQLSLQDKDNNNNNNNNTSASQFVLAKGNVLETKRRMSRRGSGFIHDLMQAQNDATLQQEIELAEKKAATYNRLNARLKNKELVNDVMASSEEDDNDVASVASVETASIDGSVEDIVVAIKVVERKKKGKKKVSKGKTNFRNRQKTKLKARGQRKNKNTKGMNATTIAAQMKEKMKLDLEPMLEVDDDEDDAMDMNYYMNASDSDSNSDN